MESETYSLRKTRRNIYTFCFLCSILFIFTCPGVTGDENNFFDASTCSLLTVISENSDQMYPEIFEGNILWIDLSGNAAICLYNISSGNETPLISNYIAAEGKEPGFFGDYISFTNFTDSGSKVILYELQSGDESWIAGGNGTVAWNQNLGQGTIVWSDNRIGSFDIYLLYISNQTEILLSSDTADTDESNPKISGDYVTWQSVNQDTYMNDIYLHSLVSGNTTLVTPATEYLDEINPAINGDYLVYQGMNPDTWMYDIYLYMISSGETRLLTPGTEECNEEYPAIDNGRVVWVGQDPEEWTYHLFLHDIDSNITRIIERPDNESYPSFPAISSNRIVWQQPDPDTGYFDIYMSTLGIDEPSLVADFSCDMDSGGAPLIVNFTDLSSGEPSGWLWDFGDGASSCDRFPVHEYTSPGAYDVSLIVHTPYQRSGKLIPGCIFVGNPPIPAFSYDPYEGLPPLTVRFLDQSANFPDSYSWDFGDGTSSSEMNPVHTYTSPGSYDVSLTTGNEFGNATASVEDCIMVMGGTGSDMILGIPGISCSGAYPPSLVTLNTSLLSLNVIDNSTVEAFPGSGFGIERMNFTSETGFTWTDPNSLSGVLTDVTLESPTILYGDGDRYGSVSFQIATCEYTENGVVHAEVWENATPDDYARFNQISQDGNASGPDTSLYSGVRGVAFTTRFGCENLSGNTTGVLLFAIDSDWVEEFGWRLPVSVESDPAGAFVYMEGICIGTTPLILPSNLPAGNHTLTITRKNYQDEVRNVTLEDKRDSIRVIRIADDGSGEILPAQFLSHDPVENLDYFRAESPHGFSTFGAVSVSKAGSPIQIIYLALSEFISSLVESSGGGGPSYSGSVGSHDSQPTTIPTTSPTLKEVPTVPTVSTTGTTPAITATGTAGITEKLGGASPVPTNLYADVPSSIPFTLIQFIAVVSAVALVAGILVLRWQKGGEKT